MGISHLLEALERDAQREIEQLTAAARAEADAITSESNAQLGERHRKALEDVDGRHRHELEQALTTARRAARRAVLEARQRLQQRVFAAVHELLPGALDLEAYRNGLPAALERALAALGAGPAVVRCTPALRSLIEAVQRPAGVSIVPDDGVGSGFVVQVPDGSVDVVDTLEQRLERRRPELTRWLFAHIDGGV